ncbi:hypothetical protein ERJ75_000036700 [Trypanosoma vivax]|uniref:Uncharacterized protein n=1 Tax=Trypanosoma vivax (strain Y486) TaxID=1055687 RepID=G0U7V6_TRYVY|nr:hypothetical protein TRVL_00406 [Trypanosoma vivax]KAH8620743.1 hypothetical protein ERJ75_000036700 [Trypanosoma vivax]CCC51964.1 conserved hypothetical protein [Trypanosoma vivax Y486]
MSKGNDHGMVRVLVVGDTGVGKTLLLQRLHCYSVRHGGELLPISDPTAGFHVEVIPIHREPRHFLPGDRLDNSGATCAAFIEVGGNRNFGPSGQLPIRLMTVHGVIFIYDCHNIKSASNLKCWYDDLKNCNIVGGRNSPKVMLIETVLSSSKHGASVGPRGIPDEHLGTYLRERARDSVAHKQGLLARSWFRLVRWWSGRELSVSDFKHPRQHRGIRLRSALFLYRCFAVVENFLLYLMAVALFGPSQKSVLLWLPPVEAALATIEGDPSGTRTLNGCPLYGQKVFEETAACEIHAFLSTLDGT